MSPGVQPSADSPHRPNSPVSPILRPSVKLPVVHQTPRPGSPLPRPSPNVAGLDLSTPPDNPSPPRPDSPMPARPDSPLPAVPNRYGNASSAISLENGAAHVMDAIRGRPPAQAVDEEDRFVAVSCLLSRFWDAQYCIVFFCHLFACTWTVLVSLARWMLTFGLFVSACYFVSWCVGCGSGKSPDGWEPQHGGYLQCTEDG